MNALMDDARRFSDFILKNYPRARDWEDPVGWCVWNIARGFIAVVCDGPEIVAMCAARPVDKAGFGVLDYYFNERGNCLHIDLLIDTTDNPRAIIVLRNFFFFRFGHRRHVTMFRHHEESIHVYTYNRFWLNLSRIKMAKKRKRDRSELTTKSTSSA